MQSMSDWCQTLFEFICNENRDKKNGSLCFRIGNHKKFTKFSASASDIKIQQLSRGSLAYRMKNNKLSSRFFKHIRAVYSLLPEDKPWLTWCNFKVLCGWNPKTWLFAIEWIWISETYIWTAGERFQCCWVELVFLCWRELTGPWCGLLQPRLVGFWNGELTFPPFNCTTITHSNITVS